MQVTKAFINGEGSDSPFAEAHLLGDTAARADTMPTFLNQA